MLPPIDRFIKKRLKSFLHSQKEKIIKKAISRFEKHYPNSTEEQTLGLKKKLNYETTRIYPVVDAAVLKGIIIRSRYTFWFIAIVSSLVMGGFENYSLNNLYTYFTPLIMSFCTWLISLLTIPVLYNQRIVGAMNSTIDVYAMEAGLIKALDSHADLEANINNSPQRLPSSSISIVLHELQQNSENTNHDAETEIITEPLETQFSSPLRYDYPTSIKAESQQTAYGTFSNQTCMTQGMNHLTQQLP